MMDALVTCWLSGHLFSKFLSDTKTPRCSSLVYSGSPESGSIGGNLHKDSDLLIDGSQLDTLTVTLSSKCENFETETHEERY